MRAGGRPTLSLTQGTHVDVDPLMVDAYWLRANAQRLVRREHVNQPFPEGGKIGIDYSGLWADGDSLRCGRGCSVGC